MGQRRIAIAGCGVGGLAAALLLSRAGEAVELFERFETPQPVGSGLMIQPTGLSVLQELGLADRVMKEGARIDRLFGTAGGRVVLDVSYGALSRRGYRGIGLHRSSLFNALFEAVTAQGVPVHTGHRIVGSRIQNDQRILEFEGGDSQSFDLVVDGLGTRTPLAPPTGRELAFGALWASIDWPRSSDIDPHMLTQRYRRSSKMVGILPIGTGPGAVPRAAFFWSIKADDVANWQQAGLEAWKQEVRDLWPATAPFLDQINDVSQLTFARYAHRTLRRPFGDRILHLGDAWHSASPQLGQGANMALLDAMALSLALRRHKDVAPALLEVAALRQRHVLLYQWLTWLFTPVYQSDSLILPAIRDYLVGPLSKLWPATKIQAAMVSGLIGNPLRPLGMDVFSPTRN